jgi:tRNA wybutosine-synthesizing protein 2
VLWVRDHAGAERVPDLEVLRGEAGEVVHRENGLVYRLDPSRVMFSGGNREEKARLAALAGRDERAADLFAGIGYFALPLARAGARVHAMEINPEAFGYLEDNLAANGLTDRVEADCGDCRDLLRGVYDRLVLGHFEAPAFLGEALAHVRGGSVLHVHGVERTPGDLGPALGRTAADCGHAVGLSRRTVKTCGPRRFHAVYDLVIL